MTCSGLKRSFLPELLQFFISFYMLTNSGVKKMQQTINVFLPQERNKMQQMNR